MNDGALGFGIGIDFNTGGLATHLVEIEFEDGRHYKFKATIMRDEEDDEDSPITIYKVEDGEKDYSTYIEWTDDESLTICLDNDFIFADLLDNSLDEESMDFGFDCEDDGIGIHIKCENILGSDDMNIEDIIHTSFFDLDENEINTEDYDDDGDEDWDDDEDEDKKMQQGLAFAENHPYVSNFSTVLVNEHQFERIKSWVKRYVNFYNNHCGTDDYKKDVYSFVPEDDNVIMYLSLNDLLICIEKLGLEIDSVSIGGMVFVTLLHYLQHDELIESPFAFWNLEQTDADNFQDLMDDVHRLFEKMTGAKTFVVSTVLESYNKKLANRYIDMMQNIAQIIYDICNDDDLNEDFIDEIEDLKS